MKANVCDICRKISNRTAFDVCDTHYYIFVRRGLKSEERNGRVPRMRYNIADICFDCLKQLFNGEMAAIMGQPKKLPSWSQEARQENKERIESQRTTGQAQNG